MLWICLRATELSDAGNMKCVFHSKDAMEEKLVLRMTGLVSLGMVAAMLPSLACALNQEPEMVLPFLGTILIGFGFGAYALRTTVSQRKMRLSIRGGAVFLGLSWLYTSLLGAVPYIASGDFSRCVFRLVLALHQSFRCCSVYRFGRFFRTKGIV